jgi:hypothetical protein
MLTRKKNFRLSGLICSTSSIRLYPLQYKLMGITVALYASSYFDIHLSDALLQTISYPLLDHCMSSLRLTITLFLGFQIKHEHSSSYGGARYHNVSTSEPPVYTTFF